MSGTTTAGYFVVWAVPGGPGGPLTGDGGFSDSLFSGALAGGAPPSVVAPLIVSILYVPKLNGHSPVAQNSAPSGVPTSTGNVEDKITLEYGGLF